MIQGLYAIHDQRVQAFNSPFSVAHDDLAIRGFIHEINRPGSDLGNHFRDYSLWKLGEFDDQAGVITPKQLLLKSGVEVRVPVKAPDNLELNLEG